MNNNLHAIITELTLIFILYHDKRLSLIRYYYLKQLQKEIINNNIEQNFILEIFLNRFKRIQAREKEIINALKYLKKYKIIINFDLVIDFAIENQMKLVLDYFKYKIAHPCLSKLHATIIIKPSNFNGIYSKVVLSNFIEKN